MAIKEIEIETNTLATDIGELTNELEVARKYIQTMATDMTELDTMWDGPANQVFMMQFQNDVQYAEEICGMLQKLIECMEYAKKQYDSCESEVSSLIASI